MKKQKGVIENSRARFEYAIGDMVEAGVVLEGREVKSLRSGRGSIRDAFVRIVDGEAWLLNTDIPGYGFADLRDYDPRRSRKLLLHKKEIQVLEQATGKKSVSLVPLKMYLKKGVFKVLVGVGRGKKEYEKREVKKRRDLEREVRRDYKAQLK